MKYIKQKSYVLNYLPQNIYNFMDGINGITGLYSIVVLFGFYLINSELNVVDANLILCTFLSLLVFGFYNFRKKARFFAGDIGSITIAMILFFIGVSLVIATKSPLILFSVVVYGADALHTLLYRIIIKENLTEAHRLHLYQKLVHVKKWSHLKVSGMYAMLQLSVSISIYYSYDAAMWIQYGMMLFFVFFFSLLYYVVFKRIERVSK
ncbi:hypothetical protein [Polaribacter sp. IC063]|uniref:hypothetical protein n=1 Tax=Polaribacter sp. IC063 TaxID=57031 RepID=UPI0011BDEFE0|nr:hypothetical protein [Polaribacter sp. IC063]TXD46059.1 hypothetical protein ES043_18490 [Polaribacter sp. IC063]